VLHDKLRRRAVSAANLKDTSAPGQGDLRHVSGTDGLHGGLGCADIQRFGDGVQRIARLLTDTGV
jgi:hypothetical protein